MTLKKYPKEWDKNTIEEILKDLDDYLLKKGDKVVVTAIGGVVIVLQDYQPRSTNDLDLAPAGDAGRVIKVCEKIGVKAQIATLCSTVDFNEIKAIPIFSGNALTLNGVGAEDLIRLKLERFKKHDPEDIYAIIQKDKFPYERFVNLVDEGRIDFIGRANEYLVSALLVVERMYPNKIDEFSRRFRLP